MMVESCMKCKQFVFINENYTGQKRSQAFRMMHDLHPVQIIDDRELNESFKNITIQTDRKVGNRHD